MNNRILFLPSPPRWTWLRVGLASFLLTAVPAFHATAGEAGQVGEPAVVHFAFSKSMFKDINENDAKAAMRVYAKTMGDAVGIDTLGGLVYPDGTNAIAEMLRLKQIDMISLTTEEFLLLEDQGLAGPFLMSTVNHSFAEEYVLLVREGSPIQCAGDLKGHSLIVLNDLRSALAPIWLEVYCREHGLGPANQVFAKVTSATKVTQTVLPVFFGKADVCIATRNGWEVMGELNPQVKKQLRVVATSPPVVPGLSCFRRDFSESLKERLVKIAEESRDNPTFKQVMALFKTEELSCQNAASLDSTRQLMAAYHRLCAETNQAVASGSEPADSRTTTVTKEPRMTAGMQSIEAPHASPP